MNIKELGFKTCPKPVTSREGESRLRVPNNHTPENIEKRLKHEIPITHAMKKNFSVEPLETFFIISFFSENGFLIAIKIKTVS